MKIATSFLAGLLLIGTLGATATAMAADGVIYKQELTPGSYCHLKFPAIRGRTLDEEGRLPSSTPCREIMSGFNSKYNYSTPFSE